MQQLIVTPKSFFKFLPVLLSTVLPMASAQIPTPARQKYALVIGISHYIRQPGLDDLDGPGPDKDAMLKTLAEYGFPSKNIYILTDSEASREGILSAFDKLIARVNSGDYVFIYYSGHGTSPQDWHELPIDGDTGALIPADYVSGTPEEAAKRLVVGRRDLRPRLMQLDSKATVFAILDTCFSQNLMKSVRPKGKSRGVAFGQLITRPSSTRSSTRSGSMESDIGDDIRNPTPPSPYPYKNVAWISAALAGQPAVDIDKNIVDRDPRATVDGKPHGALTNAVLMGLSGAADLNHDGVITHAELYDYLQRVSTTGTWSHQPAWSANEENHQLPSEPVLGGRVRAIQIAPVTAGPGGVRVQLEGEAASLAGLLRGRPGIVIDPAVSDLVVRAEGNGYRIYEQGDVAVTEEPLDRDATVARIAAEPDVRRLVNWNYPVERARLQIGPYQDGQPSRQGVFIDGQDFELRIRSSARVWPLVVDIDVTGYVTVLYPLPKQKEPVAAEQLTALGEADRVSKPFGIEYVKALAFDRKPEGYESWAGEAFPATDPRYQQLLKLAERGMADTTARMITQSKDKL